MPEYKHKEAFCLMWYGCPCGHKEQYWNSRDGVTPFGTSCPSCGSDEMRHILWNLDQCKPHHKPHIGQRVWVDMTRELAERIARLRIKLAIEAGYYQPDRDEEQLVKDVIEGVFMHGTPPAMEITGYESKK